ncbi:MAG: hypothetical protein IT561_01535 [Alphaproteobacteria bacterium]|nr:hypothetical protein [Alphaproteobacteria bacterium]
MYADRSLVPTEAVRLAALGFLADGPCRYGVLAMAVRQFIARTVGPSTELLGPSIELLRLEGLLQAEGGAPMDADPELALTEAGIAALRDLLQAPVRATQGDLNRLVIALKLRFLGHLDAAARPGVIAGLSDAAERERERLVGLRASDPGLGDFAGWLDLDIAHLDRRIDWLRRLG